MNVENLHPIHSLYWTPQDLQRADELSTFEELLDLGRSMILRVSHPVHVLSGPISTGGFNNVAMNLESFRAVTEFLFIEHELPMFSWILFERAIKRLKKAWEMAGGVGYCAPILTVFYDGMFETGKIDTVHMMHDSLTSVGGKHEKATAERLGIKLNSLDFDVSLEAMRKYGNGYAHLVTSQ